MKEDAILATAPKTVQARVQWLGVGKVIRESQVDRAHRGLLAENPSRQRQHNDPEGKER